MCNKTRFFLPTLTCQACRLPSFPLPLVLCLEYAKSESLSYTLPGAEYPQSPLLVRVGELKERLGAAHTHSSCERDIFYRISRDNVNKNSPIKAIFAENVARLQRCFSIKFRDFAAQIRGFIRRTLGGFVALLPPAQLFSCRQSISCRWPQRGKSPVVYQLRSGRLSFRT